MAHMLYLTVILSVILGITTLPRISTTYESNPFWTILPRIFDVRDTPHFAGGGVGGLKYKVRG